MSCKYWLEWLAFCAIFDCRRFDVGFGDDDEAVAIFVKCIGLSVLG